MTERTFTAAEMKAHANGLEAMDPRDNIGIGRMRPQAYQVCKTSAAMLRQAAAESTRWAALKVELEDYANQRGDDSVSTYRLGAKSMAQTALDIMARIEGGRA